MAIYHYSAKVIGRSTGRSICAAAAYRAAEDIHDSSTGLDHKYSRRGGVIESEIRAPKGAPDWATDREQLWNTVEHSEKRKDAQLAREIEKSLPHELPHESRKALAQRYADEMFISRGMIADISYHAPGKGGDSRNHHVHVLLTTRPIENGEFGNKNRDWNSKAFLFEQRERWAEMLNQELERIGSKDRVDHRSFEERGSDQKPTKHLGPDATEMERRGEATRIGDENRQAENWNRDLAELEQEEKIIDLAIEREKRRIAQEQTRKAALAQQPKEEPLREKTQGFQTDHMIPTLQAERENALHLRHLDERRALEAQIGRRRAEMEATTKRFYDPQATQEALTQAQEDARKADTLMGRVSGHHQEALDRAEALRLNLEDIERRQAERQGFFDRNVQEQLAALEQRHQSETERLHDPPSQERETEDFREHTPTRTQAPYPRAVNDNELSHDLSLSFNQSTSSDYSSSSESSSSRESGPSQDSGPSVDR